MRSPVLVLGSLALSCLALLLGPRGVRADGPAPPTPTPAPAPAAAPAPAPAPTANDALAALRTNATLTPEQLEQFDAVLTAAANAEPDAARWLFARSLIATRRQNPEVARDLLQRAIALDPTQAEYHARLGTALFSTIRDAGLGALSTADDALAAYDKALELDPTLTEPHYGKAMFYMNAPALAGGSNRKARKHAQALIDLPDGRGAFLGHMALAQLAQNREAWDDMAAAYRAAQTATGDGANPANAIVAHASALLRAKKDPAAALAIITQLGEPDDQTPTSALSIRGQALVELKRPAEAEAILRTLLQRAPTAQQGRFALARALEQQRKLRDAREQYQDYLTRFPTGPRADDAKDAIRRIDRALR